MDKKKKKERKERKTNSHDKRHQRQTKTLTTESSPHNKKIPRMPTIAKSPGHTHLLSACLNSNISFISICEDKHAKNRKQKQVKTGLGRETPTALGSTGMGEGW